jgi:hypothetical protein
MPLAPAQAAGLLAETGMATESYLDELRWHANLVMSERPPSSYPVPLAAAVRISVLQLEDKDPAALHLLRLCAPMAPEPVPQDIGDTIDPINLKSLGHSDVVQPHRYLPSFPVRGCSSRSTIRTDLEPAPTRPPADRTGCMALPRRGDHSIVDKWTNHTVRSPSLGCGVPPPSPRVGLGGSGALFSRVPRRPRAAVGRPVPPGPRVRRSGRPSTGASPGRGSPTRPARRSRPTRHRRPDRATRR